jgi:hypothetical protein
LTAPERGQETEMNKVLAVILETIGVIFTFVFIVFLVIAIFGGGLFAFGISMAAAIGANIVDVLIED